MKSTESLIALKHIDDEARRTVVRVLWNMGKRCNYDCCYCPIRIHDNTSNHMDVQYFQSTMENLSRFYKDKKLNIALTGGEPFVHPEILSILSILRSFPATNKVTITTNGSLPFKKYEKALNTLDHIAFSWHFEYARSKHMKTILSSIDNKFKHKFLVKLMFLPGYLDKVHEIVSWLTKSNMCFIIRRIRPLYDPVKGFNLPGSSGMKGVERYHSQYSGANNAAAEGYYSKNELEYLKSFENSGTVENDIMLYALPEHREKSDFVVYSKNSNVLLQKKLNTFVNWQCRAGIESLYIDNTGDVFRASCRQGGKQGNIADSFLNLNPKPITCKATWCNCEGDLSVTKWKNGYEHVMNEADHFASSKESIDNKKSNFREFSEAVKNYFYRFKGPKP